MLNEFGSMNILTSISSTPPSQDQIIPMCISLTIYCSPQSTEVPYLDHGEPENEPIEKVYVTTLVTPMGLFNYVDGINSKITPKK